MKLSKRIRVGQFSGGAAPFNPTSLAWTNFFKENYPTGNPWPQTATAGTSGSSPVLTPTIAIANGVALNGKLPAKLDKSQGAFGPAFTGGNAAPFAINGATMLALLYVRSTNPTNALVTTKSSYNDAAVIQDTAGNNSMSVASLTAVPYVSGIFVETSSGTYKAASQSFTLNAWHLFMVTADGVNIKVYVDSQAVQSTACGPVTLGSGGLFGECYQGAPFLDADVMRFGTANVAMSAAQYANIKTEINTTFGLAL